MKARSAILWFIIAGLALLFSVTFLDTLVFESRFLTTSKTLLKAWTLKRPRLDAKTIQNIKTETLRRVQIYENLIGSNHLIDGMLVNRNIVYTPTDVCDSLLFSSLRYVALEKLGLKESARQAWSSIAQSKKPGEFWTRHPLCKGEALSRDMFLGIVSALSQEPSGAALYLEEIAKHVNFNSGFFAEGPVYVSFVTPSLKFTLDRLLGLEGIAKTQFLSTNLWLFEWETYFNEPGYEAHLTALHVWLNGEISRLYKREHKDAGTVSNVALKIFEFLNWFTLDPLDQQKSEWVVFRLYWKNQTNLFFKWLFLKELGLLNTNVRYNLLQELLNMREFPKDRLPWNCDRTADYLWQRKGEEYAPSPRCWEEFHGTDFLWMAAMLLEPDLNPRQN